MMTFSLNRETLLKPLQLVTSVVDKKHSMPILGNVLLTLNNGMLDIVATDLETKLSATLSLAEKNDSTVQAVTVPARKFLDIIRSLPENQPLTFSYNSESHRCTVQSGRSRFVLSTMSAEEYPEFLTEKTNVRLALHAQQMKQLFDSVSFSMALQDVRYFLNGMLLVIEKGTLRSVATDGHRLSTAQIQVDLPQETSFRAIVPRKCVYEITKMLTNPDASIEFAWGGNFIQVTSEELQLCSRLLEGKFPNYQNVIPLERAYTLKIDRNTLKQALQRASVLFSEKFHGVRFLCQTNNLRLQASNTEREEAYEEIEVDYQGPEMEIGFNLKYLVDVVNAIEEHTINIQLKDPNASALIQSHKPLTASYVIMPMKL